MVMSCLSMILLQVTVTAKIFIVMFIVRQLLVICDFEVKLLVTFGLRAI